MFLGDITTNSFNRSDSDLALQNCNIVIFNWSLTLFWVGYFHTPSSWWWLGAKITPPPQPKILRNPLLVLKLGRNVQQLLNFWFQAKKWSDINLLLTSAHFLCLVGVFNQKQYCSRKNCI